MPRLKNAIGKTTFSTSKYGGSRQAMSQGVGGKLGRKGNFITRRKSYYDIRLGLGLSGG